MLYVQPRICLGEWDAQTPMRFWDTNGSPNLGQTTGSYNQQQKKKKKKITCKIVDFAVPTDHKMKFIERKKKDIYLDLVRELEKLWDVKVTFIPIVIGAPGTVNEGLEDLKIRGRMETILNTALLR